MRMHQKARRRASEGISPIFVTVVFPPRELALFLLPFMALTRQRSVSVFQMGVPGRRDLLALLP